MAAVAAAGAVGAPAAPHPRCAPTVPDAIRTGSSAQLVTVVAPSMRSTSGTLRLWSRRHGCWSVSAGPWRVYLGYAGLSEHHYEGDGTTPVGLFGLGPVVYGVAPNPGLHYPYHRLVCGDWWDEDSASRDYNTFQHVPCGTIPPFAGASEALWHSSRAYAHFAFVEYNAAPAVADRGSAIFIHADLGHPTNGCVSLPRAELVRLLRRLRPAARPLVAIGTLAELRRL